MKTRYKDNRIALSDPSAKACLLASFLLPVILLLVAAWKLKIAPFSDTYYMPQSMQETYIPVISEFWHKVRNGESLFYTWNSGGGTSFWNLIACYAASPFTWLYVCFKESDIAKVTQIIFALKAAFASLFFSMMLWKKEKNVSPLNVAFSCAYGLSGFMVAYYEEPWLLDAVVLLPLLILGAYFLIQGCHKWLFTFSLALICISSWQAGVYVLVFIVVIFPMLVMERYTKKEKEMVRKLLMHFKDFALAFILALGISAFVWFPTLFGLLRSTISEPSFKYPQDLKTTMTIFDCLARFSFDSAHISVTDTNQLPSVYCGIMAMLFVVFYGMSEKIPFKEKIYSFSALLFFYITMANRLFSFVFSGLHYPITSTYPQAFLLVFMVMYMVGRALGVGAFSEKHRNLQIASVLLIVFMLIQTAISKDLNYDNHQIYYAISFIIVYFAIISFLEKENNLSQNRFLLVILSCVLLTETAMSIVHPLKDRYFVRSMKNTVIDSAIRPMSNEIRQSLLPNQKNEWVYELNSAVTYHEPDEETLRQINELKQGLNAGERLALYNEDIQNYGLLFHVPSIDSSMYIQPVSFLKTLRTLSVSQTDEELKAVDTLPWLNKFFYIAGTDSLENLLIHSGSLGYFTDSESIYNDLVQGDSPLDVQNTLARLFIENDILEDIDYSIVTLDHITDQGERIFKANSSKDMGDAVFSIKPPFNKPIYILCDCEQEIVLEVRYLDGNEDAIHTETCSEAQSKWVCLDTSIENVEEIRLHLTFSRLKSETFSFHVAQVNTEDLHELERKMQEGAFHISEFGSAHLKGNISAQTSGNLLFTIPYDNCWTVYVDGQKTKVFRACDAFLGIHLTEGEHQVTMKYEPMKWKINVIGSAIFIILTVGIAVTSNRGNGKKKTLTKTVNADNSASGQGENEK